MDESRTYAGLLNIRVTGKNTPLPNGVTFGEFDSPLFIDEEGKPYPAMIIVPEAIWRAEGKRARLAVTFKFLDENSEELTDFEDVFIMVGTEDADES